MNIFQIFIREGKGKTISQEKLCKIREKYCPTASLPQMFDMRRAYHYAIQSNSYRRPMVRKAPLATPASANHFIMTDGTIIDSPMRLADDCWEARTLYRNVPKILRARIDKDKSQTLSHYYSVLQDKRYHICVINEHTVPKWCPRSFTLCADPMNSTSHRIFRLLKGNHLVLRCSPLENDQYDLWTFSIRSKSIQRRVATLIGDTLSFGKNPRTSRQSHTRLVAKKVTEKLDAQSM